MKHALITGASSGIGKALAKQFIRDGYDVTLVAEREKELADAVEELSQLRPGTKISALVKDLTDPEAPQEIYAELAMKKIEIDALVNDAGVGERGPFAEMSIEKMVYILRLNVEALTRLTALFLPPMLSRERGRILNVGSIAGFQPGPLLAVYHASKAYVVSLSEALAEELKDTGVTVTCLCPGATDTNFFARAHMEDARGVQDNKLMDPETVAEGGYKAFKDGERVYIPGAANKAMTFMRRVIPISLQARFNKKLYESVEE